MDDRESMAALIDPQERRRMQNRLAQRNFRNRRNQQRVSQALAAPTRIPVPSHQHPTHHQPPEPAQQPTPPLTEPNTSLDLSFEELFATIQNGVADVTPPALIQEDVLKSSTSLPRYDAHHNPPLLSNNPLDPFHNLQAPRNVISNGWEAFLPHDLTIMASLSARHDALLPNFDDVHLPVLHYAAFRGRTSIVSILLDRSLPINEQDSVGRTALHLAAVAGHADAVNTLVARGACMNMKDCLGRTPIHWAALGKHKETLNVLINRGADVNVADTCHWTAVHICAERGWEEGLTAVLHAGGDLARRAKKCED